MDINTPAILVIFGISGDLAKRKLLPAISHMAERGVLPKEFHIVGVTRQSGIVLDDHLTYTHDKEYIKDHTELFQMDLSVSLEYARLGKHIEEIEKGFSKSCQILLYVSVPPTSAYSIIELIGMSEISRMSMVKLLLEKPSGSDLESAENLITHTNMYFKPTQVYRIDHYLAKETSQNIVPFLQKNTSVYETLNKDYVERIEVVASEKIGIEGRVGFYEQTGALRDFVQSHLLGITALMLTDISKFNNGENLQKCRTDALSDLTLQKDTVARAQYEGYTDEVSNPTSTVETFVSLILSSSDERFLGIPIHLVTGKGLHDKYTVIRVIYKDHTKIPLEFMYHDTTADAHEYVLSSALISNHDIFVSEGEVRQTWRIINEIQKLWSISNTDLYIYKKENTPDGVLLLKK
jgi:glucose-6-phosphate 1-dehydrogenase